MINKVFGHIAVGSTKAALAEVRTDPKINAAIQKRAVAPSVRSYFNRIDRHGIAAEGDHPVYGFVKGVEYFRLGVTDIYSVRESLANSFPQIEGFDALARDVHQTLQAFCNAAGYHEAQCRFFLARYTDRPATWHHDNCTDLKGFKNYVSQGTWGRDNSTIKAWRPKQGDYGHATDSDVSDSHIIKMEEGDFAIWKGDCHERPFIHVRHQIHPNEFRLSMTVNPTASELNRKIDDLELDRFCKELQFPKL